MNAAVFTKESKRLRTEKIAHKIHTLMDTEWITDSTSIIFRDYGISTLPFLADVSTAAPPAIISGVVISAKKYTGRTPLLPYFNGYRYIVSGCATRIYGRERPLVELRACVMMHPAGANYYG